MGYGYPCIWIQSNPCLYPYNNRESNTRLLYLWIPFSYPPSAHDGFYQRVPEHGIFATPSCTHNIIIFGCSNNDSLLLPRDIFICILSQIYKSSRRNEYHNFTLEHSCMKFLFFGYSCMKLM